MSYQQFAPHHALSAYIDAYWMVMDDGKEQGVGKILPDGCVDIIMNVGPDFNTGIDGFVMQSGKSYLVGIMTSFKETTAGQEIKLVGVRFRPAAFSAFYKFASLHEITDDTIEFEKCLSPDIHETNEHFVTYLDHFFKDRLSATKHGLLPIVADIEQSRGQTNVRALAQRYFTTTRQLERSFKQHIGISPKEFMNLVRYQCTLPRIRNNYSGKSLLDIAIECGYYDHAHLTNEIKRYTGVVPTLL